MRDWKGELRVCSQQYERWINVGHTTTDFLGYLIALACASLEDVLPRLYPENEPSNPADSKAWGGTVCQAGDRPRAPDDRPVKIPWFLFDLWHIQARRMQETAQMGSSDVQYWAQRLLLSWYEALRMGGLESVQRGWGGSPQSPAGR